MFITLRLKLGSTHHPRARFALSGFLGARRDDKKCGWTWLGACEARLSALVGSSVDTAKIRWQSNGGGQTEGLVP
jgi:hypothetical protein